MKKKIPLQEKRRISKSTSFLMMMFAVFFDLLPLILIGLVIGVTLYTIGDASVLENIAKSSGGGVVENWWNRIQVAYKAGVSGAVVILQIIFLGPILYTIGSLFGTILAFLIFVPWFYLKGVNMLSISKGSRVLANALAGIIEAIPIVNLLPGITFMVWRHIKITQMEDQMENKIKNSEIINKALRATKG